MQHEVIIIGGSYAGMAAGLQLARAKRRVLVIDAGERRNRFASTSHGFLTQDGVDPAEIAERARRQLLAYPTVEWLEGRAGTADGDLDDFTVHAAGKAHRGRRLILAFGVSDQLPDVPGLKQRWGRNVFHCPYCHGYEIGDAPIGVLATGAISMHQAMMLPDWGRTTFFTNGTFEPDADQLAALARRGVNVETQPVRALGGSGDMVTVELADGRSVALGGLFTAPSTRVAAPLAGQLGCDFDDGPLGAYIRVDALQMTSRAGVFACGDAAAMAGSVALAVGDGTRAGVAAHRSLMFPELLAA